MWVQKVGVGLSILAMAGCGTPYQDMGFRGGVEAQQMTADTYRIKSRGNAYTARSDVQDYVLLKAAETTKAAGGKYFVLIGSEDATRRSVVVSGSAYSTGDRFGVSTNSSATASELIRPGQDSYIRVLKEPTPDAFTADEIIQHVGGRVKRDQ